MLTGTKFSFFPSVFLSQAEPPYARCPFLPQQMCRARVLVFVWVTSFNVLVLAF